jgi:hypothetical protein
MTQLMTKTPANGLNRRMMPGPEAMRPDRINRSAIRTPPAAKEKSFPKSIEITLNEPMTPNPAAATILQAPLWPRKWKVYPKPKNLLDTHPEKKRQ